MQVKVLNVTERNQLGPNGSIMPKLVISYMVGSTGPYTLLTDNSEIQSGAALQKMQAFAANLSTLPIDNHN